MICNSDPDEVSYNTHAALLQVRYENVVRSSDKLVKRLASAQEEMLKFRGEVAAFRSWLEKAFKILEDKEKQLASLNKVNIIMLLPFFLTEL